MKPDRFFFHDQQRNRQLLQHASTLKVLLFRCDCGTEVEYELKGSVRQLDIDGDCGEVAGEDNQIDPYKFARDLMADFQQSGEGGAV